ncbi:MAG: hypothetical protein RL226_1560 [Bacteroidota bacterium]
MEKDKLKSFIDQHRADFDDERPSRDVWSGIEARLPEDRGRFVNVRWLWTLGAVAAMVILLLGSYIFLLDRDEPQMAEQSNPNFRLANVSEEMAEVETYYLAEVNLRIEEVKKFPEGEEYLAAVDELREEYEQLCLEMGRGADREKVVEAMIQNYRLRLEILEEMLEELRQWQQSINESHEA